MKQFFVAFIAGIAAAAAQEVANPELDFVRYALSSDRSVFEGFWGGEGTGYLSGGTLNRINYDVNGDGVLDQLLSHDVTLRQAHGLQLSWVVYVQTASGFRGLKERPEDRLEFNESMGFYISRKHNPPLITTSKYHPDIGSTFSAVMFDGGAFRKIREVVIPKTIPRPNPFGDPAGFFQTEMRKQGFDPGERVFPKMEVIALGQYLHNPNAQWMPYDFSPQPEDPVNKPLDEYYKAMSAALASFTIEDADRLIEALTPAKKASKPPNSTPDSSPKNLEPTLGANNQSASSGSIHRDAATTTPLTLAVAIFLAAASGVLWWWSRRNKS